MYFNVLGECSNTSILSSGFISVADNGTRMSTSRSSSASPSLANYENATFEPFYVFFQNGENLMKQFMVPNTETGETAIGAPDGQIALSETTPLAGRSCHPLTIILSFSVMLWFFL